MTAAATDTFYFKKPDGEVLPVDMFIVDGKSACANHPEQWSATDPRVKDEAKTAAPKAPTAKGDK